MSELQHHGITGMKWGVRRFQNKDGTLTAAGKARYGETDTGTGGSDKKGTGSGASDKKNTAEVHDDYKKAHDNKPVESMSDAELRTRLNRIQMEQQINQYNKNKVDRGHEKIRKALSYGKTATEIVTTAVGLYYAGKTVIDWINGTPPKKG